METLKDNKFFEEVEPNSERWLDLKDLPNEEWRDIKDFEGLYQVSNYGRVKRLEKILKSYIRYHETNILKPKICHCQWKHDKYLGVVLTKNNKKYNKLIHRLVAEAFIPNPENKRNINHIVPVTKGMCDNKVFNLEWCTSKENSQYMVKLGRNNNGSKNRTYAVREKHFMARKILKIDKNDKVVNVYQCVKDYIDDMPFAKSKCYKILKNMIELDGYRYVYENNNK